MELNEAFIKLMIAQEVQTQMNPLKDDVQEIRRTMRSFYSNGSGGAPGALEIWREEDKEKFAELKRASEIAEANNDVFLKHIASEQEKESNRLKRNKRIWAFVKWAAPPIGAGLLSLAGLIYKEASPVVHIIIDDYLHEHPQVHEKLKQQHTVSDLPSTYVDK